MLDYFKRSFRIFKENALSNFLYDSLKNTLVFGALLLLLKLFPDKSSIGGFLNSTITVTIFQQAMIIVFFAGLSMVLSFAFHRSRLQAMKQNLLTDELTGLSNEKALAIDLREIIESAKKSTEGFAIILMDIDNFKELNDKAGQVVADAILHKLGRILGGDKFITDTVYRQHKKGDEFVIIARKTSLENAVRAANRKREFIVATGFQIAGHSNEFHITISCGVTTFNIGKDSAESVLDRAHRAMIKAKSQVGKNQTSSLV